MNPLYIPPPKITFSLCRTTLLLGCSAALFCLGGCASLNGDPNVNYMIPQATFNDSPPSMADSVAVPYQ